MKQVLVLLLIPFVHGTPALSAPSGSMGDIVIRGRGNLENDLHLTMRCPECGAMGMGIGTTDERKSRDIIPPPPSPAEIAQAQSACEKAGKEWRPFTNTCASHIRPKFMLR